MVNMSHCTILLLSVICVQMKHYLIETKDRKNTVFTEEPKDVFRAGQPKWTRRRRVFTEEPNVVFSHGQPKSPTTTKITTATINVQKYVNGEKNLIGKFENTRHGVAGMAYTVGSDKILIEDFSYDGRGPDAFFWVGTEGTPGPKGTVLPHPFDGKFYHYRDLKVPVLKSSSSEDIVLRLPPSLHSEDIKWISVWCRKFAVDFGHVVVQGNQLAEDPTSNCFCGLAKTRRKKNRIVGGEETNVNEFPWQVLLHFGGSEALRLCGGSIISNRWILTAAHCTFDEEKNHPYPVRVIKADLGEHDRSTRTESETVRMGISKVINHFWFGQRDDADYDFSLLKMERNVDFSKFPHIRPICLPVNDSNDYNGYIATVSGWGLLEYDGNYYPNVLNKVDLKVMTNKECVNDPYKYGKIDTPNNITDQMLCANADGGGKDACTVDSGGPLVTSGSGNGRTPGQNYELIGVVSFGMECALPEYPGVYSRVTKQLPWIYTTTADGWSTCPRV